jgi:hypothetical protein
MSGNDLGPFGSKDRYAFERICRYFDCALYDVCLDTAANANWKVFTCEGCRLADKLEIIDMTGEEYECVDE